MQGDRKTGLGRVWKRHNGSWSSGKDGGLDEQRRRKDSTEPSLFPLSKNLAQNTSNVRDEGDTYSTKKDYKQLPLFLSLPLSSYLEKLTQNSHERDEKGKV